MAAAVGVRTHVRRTAEAGDALGRDRRTVAGQVNLERGADEQVAGVKPRSLAKGSVGPQRAVRPSKIHIRLGADVIIHAHFRTEAVNLFHPA